MQETIILTDDNLDAVLLGDKPVMLLITNGDGVRGDFITAFRKTAGEQDDMVFARLDPTTNPQAAARFDAGSKPLLIGWYCGETVVRRSKPWGSDMPLAVEQMNKYIAEVNPQPVTENEEKPMQKKPAVDTKPVAVTDETFQQDVIDHDLPVLIDFWAEWCGPCRMVAPILDKMAKEFAGQIRIAKVNVDENPGLSATFRIQSIPTMMMVKNRTIVFSQPGALPEPALRDLIQQLIKLEVPDPETREEAPETE
jgi:thioredoxin 1